MCWETAFKDAPLKSHAEEKAGGIKSTGQECEREPAGGGQAGEESGAPPGGLVFEAAEDFFTTLNHA